MERDVIEEQVMRLIGEHGANKNMPAIGAMIANWLIEEKLKTMQLEREIVELTTAINFYRKANESRPLRPHATRTIGKRR